jgi:hypothetical protein
MMCAKLESPLSAKNLGLGLLLAASLILPSLAHADNVVRDRFSDEIVGQGPDLVLVPGLASSRGTWKATAPMPPRPR